MTESRETLLESWNTRSEMVCARTVQSKDEWHTVVLQYWSKTINQPCNELEPRANQPTGGDNASDDGVARRWGRIGCFYRLRGDDQGGQEGGGTNYLNPRKYNFNSGSWGAMELHYTALFLHRDCHGWLADFDQFTAVCTHGRP